MTSPFHQVEACTVCISIAELMDAFWRKILSLSIERELIHGSQRTTLDCESTHRFAVDYLKKLVRDHAICVCDDKVIASPHLAAISRQVTAYALWLDSNHSGMY